MVDETALLNATTTIVSANLAGRSASSFDLGAMIRETYSALAGATGTLVGTIETKDEPTGPIEGAVSVRKSLASRDHIISMIDGKPYKTLRRHLSTNGLTPDEYRTRYGLRADYPMVAEAYSEARRTMAKKIGLGRKPADRPAA